MVCPPKSKNGSIPTYGGGSGGFFYCFNSGFREDQRRREREDVDGF